MSASASDTPVPSSKPTWTPKDYQLRAIRLMMQQGSVGLFLDPGLGKTSICLAALSILKEKGLIKRALIIAPLRPMYSTWPSEMGKWAEFEHLSHTILHGSKKEEAFAADVDIHLINPEGLIWLMQKKLDYDVLIVDESTKFKNAQTQKFKVLKPHLPSFSRRWILTGTPTPNGLLDLFGQIYILDLGRSLGRFITHYRRDFFLQSGFGGYEYTPQPDAFERITQLISPLILQLSAEDYLKMPELLYMTVEVELPAAARKVYKQVEDEFYAEIEGMDLVAGSASAASIKCRQIANGAVYINDGEAVAEIHNEKIKALKSLVEELNGHSILILYEFAHDLERINAALGGVPCLSKLSGAALTSTIGGFNDGSIRIVLGHPASMGHGLNLQGNCHHVIWFGITWDLELYDQAIARVYRQGQTSDKVYIYHIVAKDTLDEVVVKTLDVKDRTQQDVLRAVHRLRDTV